MEPQGPASYPDHNTIVLLGMCQLEDDELATWLFTLEEILDLPMADER